MRSVREAAVHRDADESSERVTSLALGEEVFVVEQRGEWTRILAPDLDGAWWLAPGAPYAERLGYADGHVTSHP